MDQKMLSGIGLVVDAFFLWNANRLYKKKNKGLGVLFGVLGATGAAWNIYHLVAPAPTVTADLGPGEPLTVTQYAQYSAFQRHYR